MWLRLLNFPNGVGGWANIAKVEVVSSNLISRSRSRPLGVGFPCWRRPGVAARLMILHKSKRRLISIG
jgi:hypothetical protein